MFTFRERASLPFGEFQNMMSKMPAVNGDSLTFILCFSIITFPSVFSLIAVFVKKAKKQDVDLLQFDCFRKIERMSGLSWDASALKAMKTQ
jgi:hypothetical protein